MTDSLLYTAANTIEAHLLAGLLRGEGIKVRLDSDLLMGGVGDLPTEVQQVRIWCSPFHLDAAKAILADYFENKGGDWYCRHCGEANGAAFELCWHCAFSRAG